MATLLTNGESVVHQLPPNRCQILKQVRPQYSAPDFVRQRRRIWLARSPSDREVAATLIAPKHRQQVVPRRSLHETAHSAESSCKTKPSRGAGTLWAVVVRNLEIGVSRSTCVGIERI